MTEQGVYIFGILSHLLLFACPLFHLLLHARHGDHDSESPQGGKQPGSQADTEAISMDEGSLYGLWSLVIINSDVEGRQAS